jgi:hypothetical protein
MSIGMVDTSMTKSHCPCPRYQTADFLVREGLLPAMEAIFVNQSAHQVESVPEK